MGDMLTQALTSDDGAPNSPSHSVSQTSTMIEISGKQRTRDKWDNKVQFLLATIGFAVGLGNIWRFPGLCYKNGGGAFLLPYIIMLIVEGIPLLYLELSVGQRLKKGSLVAWSTISPYMGGVGLASVVICIFTASYYSIVISWCLFYLFSSFRSTLPWSKCPTRKSFNSTSNQTFDIPVPECANSSSISYFFFRETLNVSESIDETTTWNWKITLCYITAWIVIYVCVIRGIKSSGKVVYFTATFPYVVLTAFFIRGMTLEGFDRGVKHLFTPQWDKLADPLIWMEAASQIFYSTGLAFGCILAFASYNPTNQNTLKDAITISLVNSATSLFASIVVFSILGFRATISVQQCLAGNAGKNNTAKLCDFDEHLQRAALGPGLVFIAFSDAIRSMPAAPVWSVMFFLMCLTLGIDSLFGGLESVSASLADLKRLSKVRIEYISGGICITCFLLGLSMVQDSGSYVVQLFDKFSANMSLLVIAICEFVSVTWFYGYKRFSEDIRFMNGSPPGIWWKACWMVISPCLILAILISSFVSMTKEPMTYDARTRKGMMTGLQFPPWAVFIGIAMTLISILLIPLVAILQYFGWATWRTWENPLSMDSPTHAAQTLIVNEKDAEANGNYHEMNGNTKQNHHLVETYF
ncbi:sodium-dependent neutral amino acid transporter B(0)AT3-like [Dendronephthya gigantea]|uniref:sodium-dependent neutral amino acid transporter B(0)AT3-like n=1 Tax=Dendronephthya gigantea TaxID=151771 RepID=UPI00106AB3BC|nr:sodium-dependent neutral amino acid transporter B(0)AT3-like [Dendronephthya gigantea]